MQTMARVLSATVYRRHGTPCYRGKCAWVDAPVYFNHQDGVVAHRSLGEGQEVHPDGHVVSFRHGNWTGVQWHPEGTVEGTEWLRLLVSKKICT